MLNIPKLSTNVSIQTNAFYSVLQIKYLEPLSYVNGNDTFE